MTNETAAVPATAPADGSIATAAPPEEKLWTRQFVQVCAGGFLSYASQQPVTPLIALWVAHLGGSAATVGLVSAAFSAPSFLLRPIIGRLCDTWSARGVFAVGCIISGLGSMLILIPSMALVFVSQVFNGIGWAGLNTGGYTLLADIAPPTRRGAASSYLQIARGSIGFYLPYLAIKMKNWTGFWLPFFLTALAGLAAAPTMIGVKERPKLPASARPPGSEPTGWLDKFVERDSVFPSSMLFLAMVTGPAISTFIVLYAKHLGIGESEIAKLFLLRGAFAIASQSALAGMSDRIGRAPAILLGLLTTVASMVMLSQATGFVLLVSGMVLSSVGGSLTPPAIQAMAIDRSKPERRGAAMATFSLSFQFGSFVGGLAGGYLIDFAGYSAFYGLAAIPAMLALLLLFARWRVIQDSSILVSSPAP